MAWARRSRRIAAAVLPKASRCIAAPASSRPRRSTSCTCFSSVRQRRQVSAPLSRARQIGQCIMTSGLEIEQQFAELLARLLKTRDVAALSAIPDDLHHVDEFGAVFTARIVELGLRLGDQRGEGGLRRSSD